MTNWQDALFTPHRVAVVGASATTSKAGILFLRNLTAVEAGFASEVVAIHPSAREILGCPAFPRLAAVPEPVDLAIVVTPPASVPDVMADCGAAGVPVAVIISGGFAESGPGGVALHVCWVAPRAADSNREKLLAAGIPCHAWPAATAAILAATGLHPAWSSRPPLSASEAIPSLSSADDAGWVTSAAAFSLLQQAGFHVTPWAVVAEASQAAAVAEKMQFPVVLKAERPGLAHKTEADAVRLGLSGGRAVAEAFEDLSRRLGAGPALVQRQAGPGVELVVGARRDRSFGPIVMAGLGGVWIEVLEDVALRLAPIDADEALAILGELKGQKLFTGVRGRPPIDGVRLARLIADLSQWSCADWLGEVDLNPIIADGNEFTIVDVRMRVIRRSTIA